MMTECIWLCDKYFNMSLCLHTDECHPPTNTWLETYTHAVNLPLALQTLKKHLAKYYVCLVLEHSTAMCRSPTKTKKKSLITVRKVLSKCQYDDFHCKTRVTFEPVCNNM